LRVFDKRDSFILRRSLSISKRISSTISDKGGALGRAGKQTVLNEDEKNIQIM
jgi:hypothetical protein